MYNEGKSKGKNEGKHCEREAKGKQIEKLNNEGCKRYLGGKGDSTSSVQFTDGQSEDCPVYSWRFIYISTICIYVALLTSQQ